MIATSAAIVGVATAMAMVKSMRFGQPMRSSGRWSHAPLALAFGWQLESSERLRAAPDDTALVIEDPQRRETIIGGRQPEPAALSLIKQCQACYSVRKHIECKTRSFVFVP
jgi:hypothetical protein